MGQHPNLKYVGQGGMPWRKYKLLAIESAICGKTNQGQHFYNNRNLQTMTKFMNGGFLRPYSNQKSKDSFFQLGYWF